MNDETTKNDLGTDEPKFAGETADEIDRKLSAEMGFAPPPPELTPEERADKILSGHGGYRPGSGRPPLTDKERALRGLPPRDAASVTVPTVDPALSVVKRDYCAAALRYMDDVTSGRIIAGKLIKQAVERQRKDLAKSDWSFYWDPASADDVCYFAERLPHIEGVWKSPLIQLEDVQCFFLTTLFGWRKVSDDTRRFDTAYIEVGRKFSKSVMASIIGLYCRCLEDEPGAQVKCAATTGGQARVVFNVCRRMVMRSKWLRDEIGLEALANQIIHEKSGSVMGPINAKSSTQDGLNPHCTIIDELHAHKDRGLFDVLRSARGSRRNPLSLYITTAGYNMLGVAYEQRSSIVKLLQGIFTLDHYLGLIFTLDEDDDPFEEKNWIKANPMIGITPRLEEMRDYAKEAKLSPKSAGEFKTKRCNLWLQSASSWLSMDAWDACADLTLKLDDFINEICWMGVDLSQSDDLTAIALVFRKGTVLYGFVRYYLPEAVVDERARAVPSYRQWVDDGVLTVTDGNIVDLDKVEEDIDALFKKFRVQKIHFDQYGSAQIGSRLIAKRIPAELLPKNSRTMTTPARDLENRIKAGTFRHDGHEILRWQASNVTVSRRVDGTILPKKEHPDSPNKIDGIDALLQADGAMLSGPVKRVMAGAFVI